MALSKLAVAKNMTTTYPVSYDPDFIDANWTSEEKEKKERRDAFLARLESGEMLEEDFEKIPVSGEGIEADDIEIFTDEDGSLYKKDFSKIFEEMKADIVPSLVQEYRDSADPDLSKLIIPDGCVCFEIAPITYKTRAKLLREHFDTKPRKIARVFEGVVDVADHEAVFLHEFEMMLRWCDAGVKKITDGKTSVSFEKYLDVLTSYPDSVSNSIIREMYQRVQSQAFLSDRQKKV